MEPGAGAGRRPSRDQHDVDVLLKVHVAHFIVTVALYDRYEPSVGDSLQDEILQQVVVPNELWLFHQIT